MPAGLLSIGTFARAAALSVGTLRHYHDEGLLVPAYVDPGSGYRYYSAAQLYDAEVVRRLRELDMPIEAVRTVVRARDARVTAGALTEHEQTMARRLREAAAIVEELQSLVTHPIALLAGRVEVRTLTPQDVLALTTRASQAQLSQWLGGAYAELAELAGRCGLAMTGPAGAIYPGQDGAGPHTVTAFIPVDGETATDPPQRRTLTGGHFAIGRHEGPYEQIGDTYRALGAWLSGRGESPAYDIREYYLAGPGDVPDPSGYLTEIAWPLETEQDAAQEPAHPSQQEEVP